MLYTVPVTVSVRRCIATNEIQYKLHLCLEILPSQMHLMAPFLFVPATFLFIAKLFPVHGFLSHSRFVSSILFISVHLQTQQAKKVVLFIGPAIASIHERYGRSSIKRISRVAVCFVLLHCQGLALYLDLIVDMMVVFQTALPHFHHQSEITACLTPKAQGS